MHDQFRRRLIILGAISAMVQGCGSIPKQGGLELQKPDEALELSRSGRFSALILETPMPDNPRGSQGGFEWLEYRSQQSTRSLLLIVGPLGQPLGGVEQSQGLSGGPTELNLFDEQGRFLQAKDQWRLLSLLAGRPLEGGDPKVLGLEKLMQFISLAAKSEQRVHETVVTLPGMLLQFRLAFDAQ